MLAEGRASVFSRGASTGQRSRSFPQARDIHTCCPYCDHSESSLYYQGQRAVILRCRGCGGLYDPDRAGEIAADDAVTERITREYLDGYRDNAAAELAIAHGVIRLLRDHLPSAAHYLEIGCGNGAIAMVGRSLPLQYTGIEVSPALFGAIDPAVRNIIHAPTLEAACDRIGDGSQDVVIMHHVLEHLPEPRRTLQLLKRKLAPGGHIFIEVPNEQWKRPIIKLRRILKRGSDDWFPGHINFFTQASLRNFLNSQGFQIVYERKVTAAAYVEMVKKMLGGEAAFRANVSARTIHAILRATKLESFLGYGIVLRCISRVGETERFS